MFLLKPLNRRLSFAWRVALISTLAVVSIGQLAAQDALKETSPAAADAAKQPKSPKADAPKADAPKPEAKAPEAPPADAKPPEAKPEPAKPDDAKPADAKASEPTQPVIQTPEKATSDKPAADKPTTDKAAAEKPAAEKPAPDAPADDKAKPEQPKAKSSTNYATMTPEQKFAQVDRMRMEDEKITPAEFEAAEKIDVDLTPDKSFKALDVDKNDTLSIHEFVAGFSNPWVIAGIVLGTLVLPFVVGHFFAGWLRLPDYSMRIGVVLLAITASTVMVLMGQLKLGIDLKGGVILVYGVDQEKTKELTGGSGEPVSKAVLMERLIGALALRINPGGQKEIVLRKFGDEEVEIVVPEAEPAEIEAIKKRIRTAGFLEFRITASERSFGKIAGEGYSKLLDDAKKATAKSEIMMEVEDPETKKLTSVAVARWVLIDPEKVDLNREGGPNSLISRKNADGLDEILVLLRSPFSEREYVVRGNELRQASRGYDDKSGELAVHFNMTSRGGTDLGQLTSDFAPMDNGNFKHRLGILFDGRLISAPALNSIISDNGIITGNFTENEVSFMVSVLNAGSLPAVLNQNPISQNEIGPTVGEDTIQKGKLAMTVATGCVLVFMALFYRFSGVVACFALLLNVLITVAVIMFVKAALTLPGLAGLALGVGMAVDANVLIFERMRDELNRGAALRMAIRNGFDKASVTIIDSNLTTVITAVVLYWIGTDQVKGFAVTLIIGIVANLFTAITCARLVFEIADRKRWLSKLTMSNLISGTKIDFVGRQNLCFAGSIIVIAVGLVATVTRGVTLLGIDFAGGTSVEMVFDKPQDVETVRKVLSDNAIPDPTVSRMTRKSEKDVQYKVDTSLGNPSSFVTEFKRRDTNEDGKLSLEEYTAKRTGTIAEFAAKRFAELDLDGDKTLTLEKEFLISDLDVKHFYLEYLFGKDLRRNGLTFTPPVALGGEAPKTGTQSQHTPSTMPSQSLLAASDDRLVALAFQDAQPAEKPAAAPPVDAKDAEPAEAPAAEKPSAAEKPATEKPAANDKPATDQPATADKPAADAPAPSEAKNGEGKNPDAKAAAPVTPAPSTPAPAAKPDGAKPAGSENKATDATTSRELKTKTALTFKEGLAYREVYAVLKSLAANIASDAQIRLTHGETAGSKESTTDWALETSLTAEQTKQLVEAYQAKLAAEPVFPAAVNVGPAVADKAKWQAVAALIVSFIAIIIYVWIRFQKVVYGVAGVVALVHDVLVTLGFIALSSYFAEAIPGLAALLQVDPFKIDLTVVAAFLTIVGFSINDTIVIFDRIREIRGKSPYVTPEMINQAVNEMLGRTFLTSFTVLLVVFILYFFGGESIHGFSFAMLVGLVSGVYSTWFIATPIVLRMSNKPQTAKNESRSPAQVA